MHLDILAQLTAFTPDSIVAWLTPIIVPLVIAGVKKISPNLPTWSLPAIAPVLGMLIDVIASFAGSHQLNLLAGAGLGLLGVAVREVKETLVPAKNGGWPDGAQ